MVSYRASDGVGLGVVEKLQLLPAVDVQGGQAVQLVQGIAGTQKEFGDPLKAAMRWQDGGAEWLHLVDLDAAFGRGNNADLLKEIVGQLDMQVELSGGIRDDESLKRALDTGARRVNIGTAALEHPDWCDRILGEHGDRIAIGLDVRGENLAAAAGPPRVARGRRSSTASSPQAASFVVTDVNSDGMLTGPNVDLLMAVAERSGRRSSRPADRHARRPPTLRRLVDRVEERHRRHRPLRRPVHHRRGARRGRGRVDG